MGNRFLGRLQTSPEPQASHGRRLRLLVLPFVNSRGDASQESFTDAMTDEVITELASLVGERVAVIARTTAMCYKGSRKGTAQIGRDVQVDYIVEGSVRRDDEQVIVNVQVVETGGETHLFARRYETRLADVFQLQESVAHDIAAHIPAVSDTARPQQAPRRPTGSLRPRTSTSRAATRCGIGRRRASPAPGSTSSRPSPATLASRSPATAG